MRLKWLFVVLICAVDAIAVRAQIAVQPLPHAHAHNDYEHEQPLADALARGFCSVEADVHLREGQLLVGHDAKDVQADRTLERLYLKPLSVRVKDNGGRVYKNGPVFWLLIDQKTEAEPTYRALHELLSRYREMLTVTSGEKQERGAVNVVVSGNRPIDFMARQPTRFAGVDGRLTDLQSGTPAQLMPMISDNWQLHFRWRGTGELPPDQRDRLRSIVKQAHDRGRIVRFWATPEEPALWNELRAADVDLINTDKLDELQKFLTAGSP